MHLKRNHHLNKTAGPKLMVRWYSVSLSEGGFLQKTNKKNNKKKLLSALKQPWNKRRKTDYKTTV